MNGVEAKTMKLDELVEGGKREKQDN